MLMHSKLLQCKPKHDKKNHPIFMKVVGELEQVFFEQTCRRTVRSCCYNVHLRPAIILKNLLPVCVTCRVSGTAEVVWLVPGHRTRVTTAEPGTSIFSITILDYLADEWKCKHKVEANPPQFSVLTFESYNREPKASMLLNVHTADKSGSLVMSVYCPFWMLNKTGRMLSYQVTQSDGSTKSLCHPGDFRGPILFSSSKGSKTSVMMENGEWSDKFLLELSLDPADVKENVDYLLGISTYVACKCDGTVNCIGVSVQQMPSGLTKQVIFTPTFVLINDTKFFVECRAAERSTDPWTKVNPGQCSPLWPRASDGIERKLLLRVPGQLGETAPFSIVSAHTTLLRVDNGYGGINVEVQITKAAVYVKISPYSPGMAPALIINQPREPITFIEKGCKESRTLKPREQVMFTWEDPAGDRELQCISPTKSDISIDLCKDAVHRLPLSEVWWVSFLDGLQRVLLFTQDAKIVTVCRGARELKQFDREIVLSMHGIGLSLVNNITQKEVLYLGIKSSGIIWETCKMDSQRFKPVSVQEGTALELAYRRYLQEQAAGQQTPASHRVTVTG